MAVNDVAFEILSQLKAKPQTPEKLARLLKTIYGMDDDAAVAVISTAQCAGLCMADYANSNGKNLSLTKRGTKIWLAETRRRFRQGRLECRECGITIEDKNYQVSCDNGTALYTCFSCHNLETELKTQARLHARRVLQTP